MPASRLVPRGARASAVFALGLALGIAACATRPAARWGWSLENVDGRATLAYGRRGPSPPDFSVICDVDAGVARLVYPVAAGAGFERGERTELLIAVGDEEADSLPAEVDAAGTAVVARALIPPAPVMAWIGRPLVVGVPGQATSLNVPPDRRTIEAFLDTCRKRA